MAERNLGKQLINIQERKNFIKDIFKALDEDGSGALDQDELIKSLISLGLSQDIRFAQRIVGIFKENQERKNKQSEEIEYDLSDFMDIFKIDKFSDQILFVINESARNFKEDLAQKKRRKELAD